MSKVVTQNELKRLFYYNKDTGLFTRLVTKSKMLKGAVAGSLKNNGYLSIVINYRHYLCHRLAFLYVNGVLPELKVDHINHDRTDNQWSNLREVTDYEHSRNIGLRSDNISGVQGVSWSKTDRSWHVRISDKKGKYLFLGCNKDFFEACCLRKSANHKYGYHKNHGYINNA